MRTAKGPLGMNAWQHLHAKVRSHRSTTTQNSASRNCQDSSVQYKHGCYPSQMYVEDGCHSPSENACRNRGVIGRPVTPQELPLPNVRRQSPRGWCSARQVVVVPLSQPLRYGINHKSDCLFICVERRKRLLPSLHSPLPEERPDLPARLPANTSDH